jgi:predicted nucleic acid-binding protein
MTTPIVLDSGPLGLVLQKPGIAVADRCRLWFKSHVNSGTRFFVPEIVDYELRRELLRLNRSESLRALDEFPLLPTNKLLVLTTDDLRLAAELWAKARQQGKPTADPHALDVDVILAAQTLRTNFGQSKPIVATSNVKHLSLFVAAAEWADI